MQLTGKPLNGMCLTGKNSLLIGASNWDASIWDETVQVDDQPFQQGSNLAMTQYSNKQT